MGKFPAFVKAVLRQWIPIGVALTAVLVVLATTVQQVYRQGANDPQIQMAEDTAAAMAQGRPPDLIKGAQEKVEITKSVAPFIIICDANGTVVSSSGVVGGVVPALRGAYSIIPGFTGETG